MSQIEYRKRLKSRQVAQDVVFSPQSVLTKRTKLVVAKPATGKAVDQPRVESPAPQTVTPELDDDGYNLRDLLQQGREGDKTQVTDDGGSGDITPRKLAEELAVLDQDAYEQRLMELEDEQPALYNEVVIELQKLAMTEGDD